MFRNLPSFQRLVRQLQKLPYLASKNIYRVALHFLVSESSDVDKFCNVILDAKKNIGFCSACFNLVEKDNLCSICLDRKRDQKTVCVVETWHDLFAIEKAGGYTGVYHVLGGVLCPLEGIGPEDLKIKPLLSRLDNSTKEVIFATNSTPEGEATANFISMKLEDLKLDFLVSRLASGVPMGSSLEYVDRVTIYKALSGRRPI